MELVVIYLTIGFFIGLGTICACIQDNIVSQGRISIEIDEGWSYWLTISAFILIIVSWPIFIIVWLSADH